MLSDYQYAVLQEMGIPVLVSRDNQQSNDLEQTNDKASNTPPEQVVEHLRATLSTKSKSAASIEPSSLTNDIEYALISLAIVDAPVSEWRVEGNVTITVADNVVSLAKNPSKLSAQDKKQLWQILVSHERSNN